MMVECDFNNSVSEKQKVLERWKQKHKYREVSRSKEKSKELFIRPNVKQKGKDFGNNMQWEDQKFALFKLPSRGFKVIMTLLMSSAEDKQKIWKSCHEKLLIIEFA